MRFSRALPRTRGRVRAAHVEYQRLRAALNAELEAAEREGKALGWSGFANKFLEAAYMRNMFSMLTEAELNSELPDAQLLAMQAERAARARDLRSAEEAARMRAERALGRAANRSLSKRVRQSMEHFDLPEFGGDEGVSEGWARRVADKLAAHFGDGAGAREQALETAKLVLVPHYMRASTRLLSAANALKAAELAEAIEESGSMEKLLKPAEKLEALLREKAERKTVEELREATKNLLNKYGGGRFSANKDLADRKLTGSGEKYLRALKKYGEVRASRDWKKQFEDARKERGAEKF